MRIEFPKHGVKHNYRGAHVTFTLAGRDYIATIADMYRDDVRGCVMLRLRHLNGEEAPSVCASFVNVLERTYTEEGLQ